MGWNDACLFSNCFSGNDDFGKDDKSAFLPNDVNPIELESGNYEGKVSYDGSGMIGSNDKEKVIVAGNQYPAKQRDSLASKSPASDVSEGESDNVEEVTRTPSKTATDSVRSGKTEQKFEAKDYGCKDAVTPTRERATEDIVNEEASEDESTVVDTPSSPTGIMEKVDHNSSIDGIKSITVLPSSSCDDALTPERTPLADRNLSCNYPLSENAPKYSEKQLSAKIAAAIAHSKTNDKEHLARIENERDLFSEQIAEMGKQHAAELVKIKQDMQSQLDQQREAHKEALLRQAIYTSSQNNSQALSELSCKLNKQIKTNMKTKNADHDDDIISLHSNSSNIPPPKFRSNGSVSSPNNKMKPRNLYPRDDDLSLASQDQKSQIQHIQNKYVVALREAEKEREAVRAWSVAEKESINTHANQQREILAAEKQNLDREKHNLANKMLMLKHQQKNNQSLKGEMHELNAKMNALNEENDNLNLKHKRMLLRYRTKERVLERKISELTSKAKESKEVTGKTQKAKSRTFKSGLNKNTDGKKDGGQLSEKSNNPVPTSQAEHDKEENDIIKIEHLPIELQTNNRVSNGQHNGLDKLERSFAGLENKQKEMQKNRLHQGGW